MRAGTLAALAMACAAPTTPGPGERIATWVMPPDALAVDPSGIYAVADNFSAAGYQQSTIARVALDGGSPLTLGTGPLPRNAVSMVVTQEDVVWSSVTTAGSSTTDDAVYALPKVGGDARVVASAQGFVHALATDDAEIFWISEEYSTNPPLHRSSIRASPKSGGSIRTVMAEDGRSILGLALLPARIEWAEIDDRPDVMYSQIASAAKDGTDVRISSPTSCGRSVMRLWADTLVCAFGSASFETNLTTGATAALGTFADVPQWLEVDSHGAFLLTNGESRSGAGDVVGSWSSLIDLSTGNKIAHENFATYAAALDASYLYWSPREPTNPKLFRVRR
jgi:hypothetical protein